MEAKKTHRADLESKRSIFLLIGFCVSLLLAVLVFGTTSDRMKIAEMDYQQEIVEVEMVEITREEQKAPEVKHQQVQVTSDIINIVRDDKKIESSLTFSDFDQNMEFVFQPVSGGTSEDVVATDEPFVTVEDMPSFQGGGAVEFRAWVQKNMTYPTLAQENAVQGRVLLEFVVERDGRVNDVKILTSPDRLLSEAAAKTVMSSPPWTAGKQRGVPVRVRYTIPIDFKLQ